jgi:hypothetical protein
MAPKGKLTKKVPSKVTQSKGNVSSDAKKAQAKAALASSKKAKSKPIISESSDESEELEMRDASDSDETSYEAPKSNKKTYVDAHTSSYGTLLSKFPIPDRISTLNSYSATQ